MEREGGREGEEETAELVRQAGERGVGRGGGRWRWWKTKCGRNRIRSRGSTVLLLNPLLVGTEEDYL